MKPVRHGPILVGAVLGAAAGSVAHLLLAGDPALAAAVEYVARPIGQIFLRLLFMLVIPLIFSALLLGVAELGDLRSLARVGWRTLVMTVLVSLIAVALGIGLVALFQPGRGMSPELVARLTEGAAERASVVLGGEAPATGMDLLINLVPSNPVRAAADGDMLAVMFFSALLGVGVLLSRGVAARRFLGGVEGLFEISMRLIDLVIRLAPIGVAALLFTLTAELGFEVLVSLGRYVGVALLAMAIHQFGVYSLLVATLGRMSPLAFFRGVQPAMVTAFATASSNATLPTSLKVAEESLGLPGRVSRFVLTVGATANQNGTALFEGVTVLFLAQLYDVSLSLPQQIVVVLVCVLGGIGTAGVPAGSIPVVAMILGMVGVPVEGIGLVLGVDRFLDMCRTTLNVTGDLTAAVVSSRGEEGAPAAPVADARVA
ncbi:MAG TPA: dicarboxylate/amino acid:cation symporter, partial [Thermoanaerobaculia bacterium]|nr:dicarboxylate/amino acid:cation symporter [Thermoanaerobaculia bacterium]